MKRRLFIIVVLSLTVLLTQKARADGTPSYWTDPPPLDYIETRGWEDWPSWNQGGDDIAPSISCATQTDTASKETQSSFPFSQPVPETNKKSWAIKVASWNLLNFSQGKAYSNVGNRTERKKLLDKMVNLISPYDIVFFQEILSNWGNSFPAPLKNRLTPLGFVCQLVTPALGWAGRKEFYAYCYKNNASGGVSIVVPGFGSSSTIANLAPPGGGLAGSYCGNQLWMRAPAYARFYVSPPADDPVLFSFLNSHTKPAYNPKFLPGGSKNPKTPPWYPATRPPSFPVPSKGAPPAWPNANASVFYEMKGMGKNMAKLATGNVILLGDLNADCGSLPKYLQSHLFKSWTWHISGVTNMGKISKHGTPPASSVSQGTCTYDRFLLNAGSELYYKASGIVKNGIAQRVDGKQVSDHHLIWVQLGKSYGTKHKSSGVVVVQASAKKLKAKKKSTPGSSQSATITGSGVSLYSGSGVSMNTANLYVVDYEEGVLFEGSNKISLTDVRANGPDFVAIINKTIVLPGVGPNYNLPTWDIPLGNTGLYRLVLDVDGDGYFDASAGDLVNSPDGYDFAVYDDSTIMPNGDVITVGDNGKSRGLFSAGKAMNIYFYAQNIPSSYTNADVYVVSKERLNTEYSQTKVTGWTWESSKASVYIDDLTSVSVPVNMKDGPVYLDNIVTTDVVQTYEVAADQTIFGTAWASPNNLFSEKAYPGPLSPFLPDMPPQSSYDAITMFGDGCSADPDQIGVPLSDFNIICNASNPFVELFGNIYYVVIDVNQNGKFDGPDIVNVQDIDDIDNYFAGSSDPIGPSTIDTAAIQQYQAFLVNRTNMKFVPDTYGVYGNTTQNLSSYVNCSDSLSKTFYEAAVKPSAQYGFFLYPETEYENFSGLTDPINRYMNLSIDSNVSQSEDVFRAMKGIDIQNGAAFSSPSCFTANETISFYSGSYSLSGATGERKFIASPSKNPDGQGPTFQIKPGTIIKTITTGGVMVLSVLPFL